MKSVLTALAVLAALLAVAWLLALGGTAPQPITLTIGTTQLQTSLPVALILTFIVLVLMFYLGRLVSWLLRLPGTWQHLRHRKAGQQLIEAYNAYLQNNPTEAQKHLANVTPDTETHAILANLLRLRGHLDAATRPEKLEVSLANPSTVVLAAWAAARAAAQDADWPEVARLTALGRAHAPQLPALQNLQFKALVNTGSPQAANLLPLLKPRLGAEYTKLAEHLLQGPTTLTARPLLESRWVKAFEHWLTTPSEDLPQ